MKYKALYEISKDYGEAICRLVDLVNADIEDGWTPIGGMAVISVETPGERLLYKVSQAMLKQDSLEEAINELLKPEKTSKLENLKQ